MSLLNDILAWTESDLTLWQRDAARRLFQKESVLTIQDYDELYSLLKAAHGLPNSQNVQQVPLAAEHLPAKIAGATTVVLKAMRDLHHVNRIAPGQILNFCPTGITVVYGGNGSGKSGYSRVLKRACRARDQAEPIHPDAGDPAAQDKMPEATFDIEIGGVAKSVKWNRGIVPPDELSTIAVFDGHCARAYLSEGEAAYQPYGLDVVENLANKVLPELTSKLTQELASISVDVEPFKHLLGNTAVGKMVAGLSEKTNPVLVNSLATLTQTDLDCLAELDKALAEADPKTKAKQVRLSAQRLEGLAKRVDTAFAWVSDVAVNKLKDIDDAAQSAIQAEKLAAEQFRAGEVLLPGTGELAWKMLFDAARKFSVEVTYPEHEFPHVGDEAKCPLCQQPLGGDASERMKRFERFVQEDAAKIAEERRKQLNDTIMKIGTASLGVGFDDALSEELTGIDGALVDAVCTFESTIAARRTWMLDAVKTHVWDDAPAVGDDPRQRLRDLDTKLKDSATQLEEADDKNKRMVLEAERNELRARQIIGSSAKAIISLIKRMRLKSALESCRSDLKTRAISDKSKEFASKAVTATLKAALDNEFQALGIGHIRTKLNERPEKGKMKYRLVLDMPVSNKIEEILSEGEQRAISIGSFLAELRLANHSGGIVFDDPVSSLDHWRRQHVARRLAEEAKQRQVVIFTHDTAFLGELRDAIDQLGVPHTMHHLEWRDSRPGHVSDGLPWGHKSYKDRIDILEKAQKAFEKRPWPAYPNESESAEMQGQYNLFRATIERVIQDVVFNGVVQRYRDWIRVDSLEQVVGFVDVEHKEIARLHKRCCNVVDAHDPSSAKNAPVPSAQEFGADLEDLKAVIAVIHDRRKKSKAS
ncbi:MAG: AAA family ATPase [Gallionellaceae bacterium]|nr:AAA family ATPase [Gallionellaceae bacterium]